MVFNDRPLSSRDNCRAKKRGSRVFKTGYEFEGESMFYLMTLWCFGILVAALIYQKLSRSKGSSTTYLYDFWRAHVRDSVRRLDAEMSALSGQSSDMSGQSSDMSGQRTPPTTSKGEIECRRCLETIFKAPFPKARPAFLRNPVTGHCLEIDCYNSALKLGVEYNGQQHYSFTSFFHRNVEASTNQKYRDELKRRLCSENGIVLIEVPYTVKIENIEPYLRKVLSKLRYV